MKFKPEDFKEVVSNWDCGCDPGIVLAELVNNKLQEWAMKTERFDNGNVPRERIRQIRLKLRLLRQRIREMENLIDDVCTHPEANEHRSGPISDSLRLRIKDLRNYIYNKGEG